MIRSRNNVVVKSRRSNPVRSNSWGRRKRASGADNSDKKAAVLHSVPNKMPLHAITAKYCGAYRIRKMATVIAARENARPLLSSTARRTASDSAGMAGFSNGKVKICHRHTPKQTAERAENIEIRISGTLSPFRAGDNLLMIREGRKHSSKGSTAQRVPFRNRPLIARRQNIPHNPQGSLLIVARGNSKTKFLAAVS